MLSSVPVGGGWVLTARTAYMQILFVYVDSHSQWTSHEYLRWTPCKGCMGVTRLNLHPSLPPGRSTRTILHPTQGSFHFSVFTYDIEAASASGSPLPLPSVVVLGSCLLPARVMLVLAWLLSVYVVGGKSSAILRCMWGFRPWCRGASVCAILVLVCGLRGPEQLPRASSKV